MILNSQVARLAVRAPSSHVGERNPTDGPIGVVSASEMFDSTSTLAVGPEQGYAGATGRECA